MRKIASNPLLLLLAIALLAIAPLQAEERSDEAIIENVRSELARLADMTVFDYVSFAYKDGHVTLLGYVTRPYLKEEAANAAAVVRGVRGVTNDIEVLSPSTADDRLRQRVYRAIYGQPALQRYANQPAPSIRIIVEMGRVALHGTVDNEADRTIAEMQARNVGQVISVENHLNVVDERAE
jgi:hyperosmotically inducible periplasmic protein